MAPKCKNSDAANLDTTKSSCKVKGGKFLTRKKEKNKAYAESVKTYGKNIIYL